MSYNYIVTAHKPSLVTMAIVGAFTGPDDLNLIQVRGSTLVVGQVMSDGLKPILDVDVFGRIMFLQAFRPPNESKDSLFLLTARYHLAILSFDPESRDVVTRAYGNVRDRVGKFTTGKEVALVDPQCKLIVLHLYAGLLKIVPLELDAGKPLKAFNIRMDELFIIDMQFVHGCDQPTIAYLTYTDPPETRKLKTAVISVREQELMQGPWKTLSVEPQANLLWPVPSPYNGLLVIGIETIAFYSKDIQHCIDPPIVKESIISCIGSVDHSRYLLGDACGRLLMLFLDFHEDMETGMTSLTGMKVEVLGETSIPHCVSYLDNGVVFLGSRVGDSQLLKLNSSVNDDGSFVDVMESMINIGPILDMSIVDLDKQGRDVLVCCSGNGKDGSLRIVKSGIGINEAATIDLPGIKGIWSLHCGPIEEECYDNTIILTFVGQTTCLSLSGEEVEETELSSLATDIQTLFCANVVDRAFVQITSKSVRLIHEETLTLIAEWVPPDGRSISTATSNTQQVLVAVGCDIYYLQIKDDQLMLISNTTVDYEVACVDVTPFSQSDTMSPLCVIGLWTDISVQILTLPNLERVFTQPLGGDIIPRSILMVELSGVCYVLCALGDGCLYYYNLDPTTGQLSNSKKVILGTKPIFLRVFQSEATTNVFACSDHPTIIHSGSNQKLLFSNVNIKEVNYMCTLNSEAFQDSLALVDSNSLTIGSVDKIQMLHIETVILGESPRCIAHQESSQTFLLGCYRVDKYNPADSITTPTRQSVSTMASNITAAPTEGLVWAQYSPRKGEVEVHSVILLDQHTFEVQHVYKLCPLEYVLSVCSSTLTTPEGDSRTVYVVGTAVVSPEEKEASIGRILVFQVNGERLDLISSTVEKGAVFQVCPLNGKLIATVNSKVNIYNWESDSTLKIDCFYSNNILSLYIKTKGDFILIGDVMKSLKLLVYKHERGLEEIGVDDKICPSYCTAIEMIDDENYIAADGRHVYICQKNTESTVEAEMLRMLQPSRIYIGDNINVFGRGSLVMDHPGSSQSVLQGKPILFGTVHGAIGFIGQLSIETYSLLSKLQEKMAESIKSVGNIEHEVYRSFATEHRVKPFAGFIDGDLVEKFLDLPHPQMKDIVGGIKLNDTQGVEVEDVLKILEDLSRLH